MGRYLFSLKCLTMPISFIFMPNICLIHCILIQIQNQPLLMYTTLRLINIKTITTQTCPHMKKTSIGVKTRLVPCHFNQTKPPWHVNWILYIIVCNLCDTELTLYNRLFSKINIFWFYLSWRILKPLLPKKRKRVIPRTSAQGHCMTTKLVSGLIMPCLNCRCIQ